MKSIMKTLAFSLMAIMLCTAALLGGAYTLASYDMKAKKISQDNFINNNLFIKAGNAPTAQSDMQKKFSVYNHSLFSNEGTYDNEKTLLQIFSKEQAAELKTKKDNGECYSLTYDEILFIINDSIQLYNKYDEIMLTNSNKYGITVSPFSISSKTIDCYHGNYSEFTYDTAIQKYDKMIEDIYYIIIYRISMLDSGFSHGLYTQMSNASSYLSLHLEGKEDLRDQIVSNTIIADIFLKSLDKGKEKNLDTYHDFLISEFENYREKLIGYLSATFDPNRWNGELKAPLLIADLSEENRIILVIGVDCLTETKVFPTVELNELRPDKENTKKEYATDRTSFENIAKIIYPEYDITRPTIEMLTKYYLSGVDGDGGIVKGMTFKELVNDYGLPYDGEISGFTTGNYYTLNGDTIVIYFDSNFNVVTFNVLSNNSN